MAASYEASMQSQIASLRSKRDTAERSVRAALEAHNSDPSNHGGYKYYRTEMTKIPERRDAAVLALERKRVTFNASRETQIAKLEEDIEVYRRKKEVEIRALKTLIENNDADVEQAKEVVANKYESQVKEYSEFIDGIISNLAEPKSQVYERNKKQVEILNAEIAEKTVAMNARLDEESDRKIAIKRHEAHARAAAEKREEDLRDERGREAAFRAMAIAREAEERRLTENEKKPPRAATPEPVKRVIKKIKFSEQSKTIAEMTEEDAEKINVSTIPDDLLDEWLAKFA